MAPGDPMREFRRVLDATKPARDAQATLDKVLPQRSALLATDTVRQATEAASRLGKVEMPPSLLGSLGSQAELKASLSKVIASISADSRVQMPSGLLDAFTKSAQPQLGTVRAAALARQASDLAQPLGFKPSLLESLARSAEWRRPAFAEIEPSEPAGLIEIEPAEYEEIEIGPPAWVEEFIAVVREQGDAGAARAAQHFEFMEGITAALNSANERAVAAEKRAAEADKRADAAEKRELEALEIARSSRRWGRIGGIAALIAVPVAIIAPLLIG